MAVCETCGASQFENVDGLYYCAFCQTQSQSVRDIEAEDESAFASYDVSLVIKKPKKKDVDKKVVVDKGRPWTTYEAFQLIILNQVKALIRLGASNDLEKVVFQLWSLYLSKTGIAFCEESEKRKTWQSVRNKYVQNVGKPMVHPTKKRKHTSSDEDSGSQSDDSDPLHWNSPDKRGKDLSSQGSSYISTLGRRDRLTMSQATCFSYLGLMYTNNLTTPSDFIRWLTSGDVPFLNAAQLLPDDMKFSSHDSSHFCSAPIPTSKGLLSMCGRLVYKLELGTLPQVDIRKLASKLIVKLNLPGECHHLMQRLFRDHVPVMTFRPFVKDQCIPNYEVIAMAYVVILLKLTLGLNDHTEKQLSEYGRKIAELVKQGPRPFIWDDWVMYMMKRTHITSHGCHSNLQLPDTVGAVKRLSDLDAVLDHHKKVAGQRNKYIDFKSATHTPLSCREETREILRKPLSATLLEMQMERSSVHSDLPTDSCADFVVFDDPLESLNEELEPGASNIQNRREDEQDPDFSVTTLTHITNEEVFLQKLEHGPLSNYTQLSQSFSRCSNISDDETFIENSQDVFTSGQRLPSLNEHRIIQTVEDDQMPSVDEQKRTVKELLEPLMRGYDRYTVYKNTGLKHSMRHRSYSWLLNVCCHVVQCEMAELELEVQKLELIYILAFKDLDEKARFMRTNILKKYFSK